MVLNDFRSFCHVTSSYDISLDAIDSHYIWMAIVVASISCRDFCF